LFFLRTIKYQYVSDDIPSAKREKHPVKWKHWLWVLEGHLKSNPEMDHFITMMIHGLVCALIYIAFGANDVSFLAAFLFMVNPANNQGSIWISGRSYVWPTLGLLACLSFPYLSPFLLLGVTFYNIGFVTPILLCFSAHPWTVAFLPVAWLFHWKRFHKSVEAKVKMELFYEDRQIHPKKLILATKTFGFYITHALFPIKNTFYHEFLQSLAGSMSHKGYTFCRFFWIGIISIISIITYIITHGLDTISFGLIWWCICIFPFLNLMRIHQEIAERYMYMPTVGLMLSFAMLLNTSPILQSIFLTAYATKLWFWMPAYKDDFWLVEYSRLHCPGAWFAWHISAMKRWDAGSRHEAMVLWVMAKMISPKEFKVLFNLSTALRLAKNETEGLLVLDEAVKHIPRGQEQMVQPLIENARKGNLTMLI
jgi:hypothetical protein